MCLKVFGYNFVFSGVAMPIYDYQCSRCGFKKEVMRKISEPNVTECPQCHEQSFTKQLSAPSFQLTGSGWYATDFKNSGSKPAPDKAAEAKPAADSSDSKQSAPAVKPA